MTEIPDIVAAALARADETGRPPRELNVARASLAAALRDLPRDARYLAVSGRAKDLRCLTEFERLEVLWISRVDAGAMEIIGHCAGLQALSVNATSVETLAALRGLASLRHLLISDAPTLSSVAGLDGLRELRTLLLWDLARFTDLSSLGDQIGLLGLQCGGGMWTTLEPDSLAPLARLRRLRYLDMPAAKARDGSLAPLADLHDLRELFLPNAYPMEQFAALAASLPRAKGDCLQPHWRGTLPCERCGTPRLLETGRGGRFVCPRCEPERVTKRAARFNYLVSRARAGRIVQT